MSTLSRILVTASLALLGACATTGTLNAEQAMHGGNSTITGVVALPESLRDQPEACRELKIRARTPNATEVGRVSVRQSRQRCAYEIRSLPSQVELTLEVQPPATWTCTSGEAAVVPAGQPTLLVNGQTLTRDLRATCPPTQAG
jgi:hypothetical protein